MSDPAAIAARLTPAQRRALLWLPADGSERKWEYRGPDPSGQDPETLAEIGLSEMTVMGYGFVLLCLTALGQRVRRVVEEAERG